MNNNLFSIIGDYQSFLKQILKEVVEEGFDLSDFVQMDHMCYRVESLDSYKTKKQELAKFGQLLGEAQVNGRPITTFRLHEPVRYQQWRIDAMELPAPKEGVATKEGLEHVELVLFDDKEVFLKKYAHKQFEMQAADRGINPEISFKLPTYTVKFHLLNLPTVVYIEKKLGITDIRNDQ
jgi:predicted metalloenzyme YecM